MKRLIVALLVLSFGFGSCSILVYLFGGSVSLELSAVQSDDGTASAQPRRVDGRGLDPTAEIALYVGIKGEQSGGLVGGHSSIDDQTMSFTLSTVLPDGTRVGDNSKSEPFVAPDPSIIDLDLPVGTTVTAPFGTFMARFSATNPTSIIASPEISGRNRLHTNMREINEVVFRTSGGDWYADGPDGELPIGTLRTAPHFVVTSPTGTRVFPDATSTVTVNGENRLLKDLAYILFVPASVIGVGFSEFVDGGFESVANPVTGDVENATRPTSWTLDSEWINDDTGNAGLFELIDNLSGISDPAARRADEQWVALATYFQGYFAKFYRSYSTIFNEYGDFPSFLVIALDDTDGPLIVEDGAVLGVAYEPNPADFTIDGDTLDITGSPVLKFRTTVVAGTP